jgi:hypothetical protein
MQDGRSKKKYALRKNMLCAVFVKTINLALSMKHVQFLYKNSFSVKRHTLKMYPLQRKQMSFSWEMQKQDGWNVRVFVGKVQGKM